MGEKNRNIEEEIRQLIATILQKDPAEIGSETRFVEDLGMDSMMALEILVSIEKKYGIRISEENLKKIASLKEVSKIIEDIIT